MHLRNSKNVGHYLFGRGSFDSLSEILNPRRSLGPVVFLIDHYFENQYLSKRCPIQEGDPVFYVETTDEPTTDQINSIRDRISGTVGAVVGIGGGATLDVAKAVSNLLGNPGRAEDYQGFDLLPGPGIFKVGVPTISGTGTETSRTCVMLNERKNLKLGMNSDYSIFDQIILDSTLSATVPRDQYFFTAMDTYIHCIESLLGKGRHALADAYSDQSISLCREIFMSDDMMSDENREKLMVASFLGGLAIANSNTGIIHPLSYGLSAVFKAHHGMANCIVMDVADEFYPNETVEFREFAKRQGIKIPKGIAAKADRNTFDRLYAVAIRNEKPLMNALGPNFKNILSQEKVFELYRRM